jgi:CPA1 family monovalent cation:H+ antiporter
MNPALFDLLSTGEEAFLQQEIVFVLLLLLISAVAILVRRIRIPYTVALVLVGLLLAVLPTDQWVGLPAELAEDLTAGLRGEFTSELILALLVPPLVFEAALHLGWQKLRKELLPVFLLAVPGVLVATLIVGELISLQLGIPLVAALAFGALISATDPVAVVAFFRSLGVDKRLSVLMEGESLLNDGVAVVLFSLAIAAAAGGAEALELGPALLSFVRVAGGGIVVGLGTGFVVAYILERVDDHLIETTLTMALAFGSYVAAESLGVGGILAVVSAGLLVGSVSIEKMSATTKLTLENFWELLAFVANSAVFLILGLQIKIGDLIDNAPLILVAVVAILVSRAIVVYTVTALSSRFSQPIPMRYRHIIFWGGLRGAVSLALALSLTGPFAQQIQLMTFGVVVFTLLVQGLTIEPLIKRLQLSNIQRSADQQHQLAGLLMLRSSKRELDRLREEGLLAQPTWRVISQMTEDDIQHILHERPDLERLILTDTRLELLKAKRAALAESLHRGLISQQVYRQELQDLDNRLMIWETIEESFDEVVDRASPEALVSG